MAGHRIASLLKASTEGGGSPSQSVTLSERGVRVSARGSVHVSFRFQGRTYLGRLVRAVPANGRGSDPIRTPAMAATATETRERTRRTNKSACSRPRPLVSRPHGGRTVDVGAGHLPQYRHWQCDMSHEGCQSEAISGPDLALPPVRCSIVGSWGVLRVGTTSVGSIRPYG